MRKRSGAALTILGSVVCASLLWASPGWADLIPSFAISQTSPSDAVASNIGRPLAGASSKARAQQLAPNSAISWHGSVSRARQRGLESSARPSALAISMGAQSYSMAAPEYLADPAAAQAISIAVGDVSGDGRDDLVFLSVGCAPNFTNCRMDIYAANQRSDGRLSPAVKIGESPNYLVYQLLIADLDRDGVGDIITDAGDGVMILRSNADGTFSTSTTTVVGDTGGITVTDVDRDGHLDILVDSSDSSATVLYGDGRGGIDSTSTLPLTAASVRTTGDITGDGLDDLILATIVGRPLQEFRVYPALPSGGYAAPVVLYRPIDANQTASLAVGDFNADGRNDLVLDEAKDGANLHLYFQDSQGKLAPSVDIARLRGSGTLITSDLDRDGRTDLAMAHSGWGYIGYYLQTATGLRPETVVEANQFNGRANYFAAGDLNHDGCGDLVVARSSQSPVLLFGQGCFRSRTADCRYPPMRVAGSNLTAASLASPAVREWPARRLIAPSSHRQRK